MPMLLLTLADWVVVAFVEAVVFWSDELPKEDCPLPLMIFLFLALPCQRVFAKLVFADPGNFCTIYLQCVGLIGKSKGLLSVVLLSSSTFYF